MLTFLKVIGTILLVLLIVLVVLLLLVLFVPIRYNAQLEYDKDWLCVKARVSWLLMFRFFISFMDKKLVYKFKVLCFSIVNSERPKKVKKRVDKVAGDAEVAVKDVVADVANQASYNATKESLTDKTTTDKTLTGAETQPESKKKFSFKLLHPAEIYYNISQKVVAFYWDLRHKIVMAFKNFDKICEMIADPANREAVVFVLSQVKALFKHVLPRKHGIYVKAGFGDPATTGQALAACSVLNNILGLNLVFEPDFDNEVLEAKVFIKGRIRLINVLIIAIKVITNKTIRKFIRRK